MKRLNSILLMAALLAGSGYRAALATDFQYDMSRATAVDITVALPDGEPALLSFYSEGENGLRLLENAFTDSLGHYLGQLQLPAHLTQVVVIVRATDRQDMLTLPISADLITYAE